MPHCSSYVPALGTTLSYSQRERRDQDDLLGTEEGRGTRAASSPAPRVSLLSSSLCLVPSARLAVSDGFPLCSTKGQVGRLLTCFMWKKSYSSFLPRRVPQWQSTAPCGAPGVGPHVSPAPLLERGFPTPCGHHKPMARHLLLSLVTVLGAACTYLAK